MYFQWIKRFDLLPLELREEIDSYVRMNNYEDKQNHKKRLSLVHKELREIHLNKGIYLLEDSLFGRLDNIKDLPSYYIHVCSDDYALYFRDDINVTWVVCRFTRKKYKSVQFAGMQRILDIL